MASTRPGRPIAGWPSPAATIADWSRFAALLDDPPADRWGDPDVLDALVAEWTVTRTRDEVVELLRPLEVPVAPVLLSVDRCDHQEHTAQWGLWPTVEHTKHGPIRVDGLPVHFSRTDWQLGRGGPLLGEDNDRVFREVLGLDQAEIDELRAAAVI